MELRLTFTKPPPSKFMEFYWKNKMCKKQLAFAFEPFNIFPIGMICLQKKCRVDRSLIFSRHWFPVRFGYGKADMLASSFMELAHFCDTYSLSNESPLSEIYRIVTLMNQFGPKYFGLDELATFHLFCLL